MSLLVFRRFFCVAESRGHHSVDHYGAALFNRAVDQTSGQRRGKQHSDVMRSGGLTEDGDPARIASKSRDIRVYPFQGLNLVRDCAIAGSMMLRCAREGPAALTPVAGGRLQRLQPHPMDRRE